MTMMTKRKIKILPLFLRPLSLLRCVDVSFSQCVTQEETQIIRDPFRRRFWWPSQRTFYSPRTGRPCQIFLCWRDLLSLNQRIFIHSWEFEDGVVGDKKRKATLTSTQSSSSPQIPTHPQQQRLLSYQSTSTPMQAGQGQKNLNWRWEVGPVPWEWNISNVG